jgi:P27 family predicted phage terminase small subunit
MSAKLVPLPSNPAPSHLSPEAKGWWAAIVAEYEITDAAGLLLLQAAAEAFDRVRECQRAIADDGMVSVGSKRQSRAHPLLAVERDARAQMLSALKALNLDLEPLRDRPGRPPGTWRKTHRAE